TWPWPNAPTTSRAETERRGPRGTAAARRGPAATGSTTALGNLALARPLLGAPGDETLPCAGCGVAGVCPGVDAPRGDAAGAVGRDLLAAGERGARAVGAAARPGRACGHLRRAAEPGRAHHALRRQRPAVRIDGDQDGGRHLLAAARVHAGAGGAGAGASPEGAALVSHLCGGLPGPLPGAQRNRPDPEGSPLLSPSRPGRHLRRLRGPRRRRQARRRHGGGRGRTVDRLPGPRRDPRLLGAVPDPGNLVVDLSAGELGRGGGEGLRPRSLD